MEHIAPLMMSVFLFVTGIEIGEQALHQILQPHPIHYWYMLPIILLATIIVKGWVGQFINYLGRRVDSPAIRANASHHRIAALISLPVIGGVVCANYFQRPEIDGTMGILLSLWILYLGYKHGRKAIIPILGRAPSKEMIQKIRETAKSVEGVYDVHEIIIHDYGTLYMISLHAEIPQKYGSSKMHEIAEECEDKLRTVYSGEIVCHTDPLLEKTPEIQKIETQFQKIIHLSPYIIGYHDFRVVLKSPKKIIIVADIDVAEDIPDTEFKEIATHLESQVKAKIPKVIYTSFYVTPKFAY